MSQSSRGEGKGEGVTRFRLLFTPAPALAFDDLREINAWRRLLHLAGLIGQDSRRYGGYGYGNISRRITPFEAPETVRRFVITGTQTGGLADLSEEHYAVVLACYPERNLVAAEGPIQPSSESLTHGTLYALDGSLRCVIHAHSPHIWRSAQGLEIPMTRPSATYGTPEMAEEVRRLFRETPVQERSIFAMGGHEDGVVSFGGTVESAGIVLIRYLARAFQTARP